MVLLREHLLLRLAAAALLLLTELEDLLLMLGLHSSDLLFDLKEQQFISTQTVLALLAMPLHLHFDARRQVKKLNGAARLIDLLPAMTAAAHEALVDVFGLDP